MAQARSFVFMDGREVEAASPIGFFEGLRRTDPLAPPDVARYLDLLHNRAALFYHLQLDVGDPLWDVTTRCQAAMASLMSHGWVRVKPSRHALHGPALQLN